MGRVIAILTLEFQKLGTHLVPLVKQLATKKLGSLKVVPAIGRSREYHRLLPVEFHIRWPSISCGPSVRLKTKSFNELSLSGNVVTTARKKSHMTDWLVE